MLPVVQNMWNHSSIDGLFCFGKLGSRKVRRSLVFKTGGSAVRLFQQIWQFHFSSLSVPNKGDVYFVEL